MRPVIDFQVLHSADPRVILIADNSTWEHAADKPSIIEIIPAGSEAAIVHYFEKGKINSFNSINLKTNCGEPCGCDGNEYNYLPDGIYSITVKGSPDTFQCSKSYLHTATTRLNLDKLYSDLIGCNTEMKKVDMRMLDEIEFLLLAAEANTRRGNFQDAQELLFCAQDKLKNCSSCKDCF